MQHIIHGISHLATALDEIKSKRIFVVADNSFPFLSIREDIDNLPVSKIFFSSFTPNPLYEQVCEGIVAFKDNACDAILSVGGGSAIDVAKCIKLFSGLDTHTNYLSQEYKDSGIQHIAIPTTAGTGSESTRNAVIYYEGKKQTVAHDSLIPNYAILEPSVLLTLPLYQKKCTMMDALCQAIESWWSVNSNSESQAYSKQAIELIMPNWKTYIFDNDPIAAKSIMLAANYAGRAISIAQTTAAHAMSYKITSMYGLPHGHAVAICLPKIWQFMLDNMEGCIDPRGVDYLTATFQRISEAMGTANAEGAIQLFCNMMHRMELSNPTSNHREDDLKTLSQSVNPVRLKNNPIRIDEQNAWRLYNSIII